MAIDFKQRFFNFVVRDVLGNRDYVVTRSLHEFETHRVETYPNSLQRDTFVHYDTRLGLNNVLKNNAQDIHNISLKESKAHNKVAAAPLKYIGYYCVMGAALVCAAFTLAPIHAIYGGFCATVMLGTFLSVIALALCGIVQLKCKQKEFAQQQEQFWGERMHLEKIRKLILESGDPSLIADIS